MKLRPHSQISGGSPYPSSRRTVDDTLRAVHLKPAKRVTAKPYMLNVCKEAPTDFDDSGLHVSWQDAAKFDPSEFY
jgi:hypothetical protein